MRTRLKRLTHANWLFVRMPGRTEALSPSPLSRL